jgi:hypothetical protein
MTPFLQQRLARFVDREGEMRSFCGMLEQKDWPRPIMLIWGEGGMGKSSLLMRMVHECSLRQFGKAEVFWTDTRNHDYVAVMRKIRDDVGAGSFVEFTNLINFFTAPPQHRIEVVVGTKGAISAGSGMELATGASVGTVAGVNVEAGGIVIKDLMLTDPRNDLGISENDRMMRLTDQFINELNVAARTRKVVIFLDAVEKATDLTQRWVWNELLGAVRDDRLANVHFVIGGRQQPVIDDRWRPLIEEKQLGPLKREHIVEYLKKRGLDLDDGEQDLVAETIFAFTDGNPFKVASAVEAFARKRESNVGK